MVGIIHDFIVRHIVAEVPDALSACLDCGSVQCLNEKWDTCPNRLARAAALCAMDAKDAAKPVEAATCETAPSGDPTASAQPA